MNQMNEISIKFDNKIYYDKADNDTHNDGIVEKNG
jgi:hypothetical protein